MKKDYIFTPGPTPVPDRVGLSQVSMVHHRSAEFSALLREVLDGLKYVFQTENDVLLFSSSGTGAMEASVANCFDPGDKVAVFAGGKFGDRLVEISRTYNLDVIPSEYEWGRCADPDELKRIVRDNADLKGVMLTHSETSTGVVNDVEAFGEIVADTGAVFLVDAISGLGAAELKTDDWHVDLAVSGSQKGLMTPPGLAFVAVSPRAWRLVDDCESPKYYFSFKKARSSQSKEPPQTPFTPAITLVQALAEALDMIKEEGIQNVLDRHRLHARATQAAVEALGLEFVACDRSRAFVTTSVWAPEGIKSGELVKLMRDRYGVFIAGGQEKLKGKIFRLGHVGFFDAFDIITQLSALELSLLELGYELEIGTGVSAALRVLAGES